MHRSTPRAIAAGLFVAALALTGCGDDDNGTKATTTTEATATTAAPSTSTTSTELEITDVWARQSPMATSNGAIYLTVTSPVDDKLVAASVPTSVAAKTEIHETVVSGGSMGSSSTSMGDGSATTAGSMMTTTTVSGGGMTTTSMGGSESMTMRPVASIALPAGEKVELKPGGYHVMLLDLVKPLAVGDEIPLTLTFETAGTKTVTAEVREG